MTKVNLFIVGAAKSGTTALYNYLNEHPKIFMSPVKEPHFFSDVSSKLPEKYKHVKEGEKYHTRIIKEKKKYHHLFKESGNHIYRGEASPSYLWDPNTANRIYQYNPDAKFVAVLRDPIERAFSHFQMAYNLGRESESDFFAAIKKDSQKQNGIWGEDPLYIELGFYHRQLKRYSALFPPNQIKIIKSEFLKYSTNKCLRELFCFLELQEIDIEYGNLENTNKAKTVRFEWLRTVRNTKMKNLVKSLIGERAILKMKNILYKKGYSNDLSIDSRSISFLQSIYQEDLEKLKIEYDIEF